MARKPIAPGANGRRKSAVASSWVRAGGRGPAVGGGWADIMGSFPMSWSGGLSARVGVESGLGQKARRAAGGASAADVAAREHEVVLGAGGGDVEQPPFLFEILGVGASQCAPGGQQLFL